MASIYLVRHGQASFGKADYDQLSERGYLQSEQVGKFLSERNIHRCHVVYGTMKRHQQTMTGAEKYWQNSGQSWCSSDFDEFDSEGVIAAAFPEFGDPQQRNQWLKTIRNHGENPNKSFQSLFVQAIDRWTSGKHDGDYKESWSIFSQRVTVGLHKLVSKDKSQKQDKNRDIVVFTSGGPIAVVCQHLLNLSNKKTFELNWPIANASVTELFYNRNGDISLASFNEKHHLLQQDSDYLTYR